MTRKGVCVSDFAVMQDLLHQYGYLIILGWTFLEGETIVIVAGFLAQKGILNPWLIALSAFAGSLCSDQLMFTLGKHKGQGILRRFPSLDKNSAKARRMLLKYETPLILGFRFVYGMRNVTPILLGISGVSHLKFLLLNIIGAGVWALVFSFGGYYFGHIFTKYTHNLANAELWLIGFILLVVAAVFAVRRARHRREVHHALKVTGVKLPPKMSRKERKAAEQAAVDAMYEKEIKADAAMREKSGEADASTPEKTVKADAAPQEKTGASDAAIDKSIDAKADSTMPEKADGHDNHNQ